MATQVQFRGGTTTEHSSFNGAAREVTVDTTKQTLVVQDGSTNGGFPLLREKNPDNQKVYFGTGNDLELYHNGSDSFISETGAGNLFITTTGLRVRNAANNENIIKGDENGAVMLYYDDSLKWQTKSYGVNMPDSSQLYFGTGDDMVIQHDGNNSKIGNATGHLYIDTAVTDGEVRFTSNNANENMIRAVRDAQVELFHNGTKKLDTATGGINVYGNTWMGDNSLLALGDGSDLQLKHDGTHSWVQNSTGNLYLGNASGNTNHIHIQAKYGEEGVIVYDDGAVEAYYDGTKKFETTSYGFSSSGYASIGDGTWSYLSSDSNKAAWGNDQDLQIYHDGTNSKIINLTNGLYLDSPHIYIRSDGGSEDSIHANANGSVDLFYDGTKKLETTSWGVDIHDTLRTNDLTLSDHHKIRLGDSDDLQIYHDGTVNEIRTVNGHLHLRSEDSIILSKIDSDGSNAEVTAKFLEDGAVELYYDGTKKLDTASSGVNFYGNTTMGDSSIHALGNGSDLQIYHDGNSYIKNISTGGNLYIDTAVTDGEIRLTSNNVNENMILAKRDAQVELYYNGSKKLSTHTNGISINTDNTSSDTGQGIVFNGSGNTWFKCAGTGDHDFAEFYRGTDGSLTRVGYIRASGSATTYSTSSDYRLKENEVAISDGITRLKTLKPYRFNFKVDPDTTVDGFFAHEVTPAVPEAITGEKDGTEMQGIDQSKLVPLLTAALQEAITKIETLETKVAALEAG